MKIAAFLQLRNELSAGHLTRCLTDVKTWADEIFIYDDCSDDGSQEEYLKYTTSDHIIFGKVREFKKELFHKKELLELTLKSNPDWIVWLDGDDVLDYRFTSQIRGHLHKLPINVDGVLFHNLNLWRSPSVHRLDNQFNGLMKINVWRNNGNLFYTPSEGLHQNQHPNGLVGVINLGFELIHYGFASTKSIVEKYEMYKAEGQSGWALDRLIDESTLQLVATPDEIFPPNLKPIRENVHGLIQLRALVGL